MVETFLASNVPGTLEICGYGKLGDSLASLARGNPRVRFYGLLTPGECLRFGRSCDVLINPRPATHGNENNFASKLFDYALCGRAILTSRLSGVETVLGEDAFYFDPHQFRVSLRNSFSNLVDVPRPELLRRGLAIQQRIVSTFAWETQGTRLADFLKKPNVSSAPVLESAEALAA